MKDLKKALNKIESRIRKVRTDVGEMSDMRAEFQADKLKGIADDLGKLDFPQTNIHGAGTGEE
jgi:hypothetical protein